MSTGQTLRAGMPANMGQAGGTRMGSGARCGMERPDRKEEGDTQRQADGGDMPRQTAPPCSLAPGCGRRKDRKREGVRALQARQ